MIFSRSDSIHGSRARWLRGLLLLSALLGSAAGLPAVAGERPEGARYTETIRPEKGAELRFEMVRVPGGRFRMGSPESESGRRADEGPVREVRLDPFYLGTTEVTLELFLTYYRETVTAPASAFFSGSGEAVEVDAVSGPTPVYGDMTMGHDGRYPAIGMTWRNAVQFCRWLEKKTGKPYRLPTEAEWEYACRAGSTSPYGPGGSLEGLATQAWYQENSAGRLQPVGSRQPNPWGLFDLQGNVREWVGDFYRREGYAVGEDGRPLENPRGAATGRVHVARGGDYGSPWQELRPAARSFEEAWWRASDPQIPKSRWWIPMMDFIGFRVACSVEAP